MATHDVSTHFDTGKAHNVTAEFIHASTGLVTVWINDGADSHFHHGYLDRREAGIAAARFSRAYAERDRRAERRFKIARKRSLLERYALGAMALALVLVAAPDIAAAQDQNGKAAFPIPQFEFHPLTVIERFPIFCTSKADCLDKAAAWGCQPMTDRLALVCEREKFNHQLARHSA